MNYFIRQTITIKCESCGKEFDYDVDDLQEDEDYVDCEHCGTPNIR